MGPNGAKSTRTGPYKKVSVLKSNVRETNKLKKKGGQKLTSARPVYVERVSHKPGRG